ncbi:unnamed protein product [Closterium sp. Naga37s-1]|nr:unnamed protein product [Closterium sp. Naga37s-1]
MGCFNSKTSGNSIPISRNSKQLPSLSNAKSGEDGNESSVKFLTYEDIKRATDNFANVLGEGGFGKVYKGRLRGVNGDADEETTFVAVKVLAPHSFQGMDEFLNEITTVEGVQHHNIVRLLACCTEKVKALVYEFIPMGDVDAWLAKCSEGKAKFPWADRMKVIMGTAEALTFIHKQRFIHRDFKSSNVLLTEDFTPKVADFGLAKGIEDWKTHVTTRVMGSMGYIDPTYFESGHLCDKSDVFAFGLFMVEILAGKSVLREETSNYPVKKPVGAGFPEYTYDEMMLMTDKLKKPIGQGGFGVVYKGYLQDPAAVAAAAAAGGDGGGGGADGGGGGAAAVDQVLVAVAVKVLDNEDVELKDDEQFHAELMAMEQLKHPTILSLYGFVAKPTPALIYEFITNGNAEAYLRKAVQGKVEFSWKARLRVALMCAEALQVMHSHNYVHRDFKASNVLLREDLTPVLADFGLARTVNNWQSHVTTRVMGSTGYIDPVYFESGTPTALFTSFF